MIALVWEFIIFPRLENGGLEVCVSLDDIDKFLGNEQFMHFAKMVG